MRIGSREKGCDRGPRQKSGEKGGDRGPRQGVRGNGLRTGEPRTEDRGSVLETRGDFQAALPIVDFLVVGWNCKGRAAPIHDACLRAGVDLPRTV